MMFILVVVVYLWQDYVINCVIVVCLIDYLCFQWIVVVCGFGLDLCDIINVEVFLFDCYGCVVIYV